MPETEVRGEDWGGRAVDGGTSVATAYVDVDMSEVALTGAVFEDCTFTGVRFNAARLVSTAFLNCTFSRCNLFDAAFTGCKLVGSRFVRCSFGLLIVEDGDWSFASLAAADLRGAALRRTRMREVDLTGARLDGATVLGVDLSGAALERTSWRDADLRGTDLSALDPASADLRGAVVDVSQAVLLAASLGVEVRAED